MEKERNNTIDFLRGCASIFIILIHTAWWSGREYLPGWFSNLFLFIDVPVFIFISGISYNYIESIIKNIKVIIKQWYKYLFFLFFYILILYIFFRPYFYNISIIKYLFYMLPDKGPLRVVGGSIWFMPMYIKVTIFCSVIIFFKKNIDNSIIKYILLILLIMCMGYLYYIDPDIIIYSIIYLLGYYSFNNKIKSKYLFITLETLMIILAIIVFKLGGYGLSDVQNLKFPPTVYYLIASMPSIIFTWYLKDKLKISSNNVINYIGKNAIFFYFSQGLSSSFLFYILPLIGISNIYLKFLILAIINIFMAIIIGIILTELYKLIFRRNIISK